ncbi:MAG TPA: glycoside hydrolase family 27 protein [Verrucomicrobiae bacterium]|nr:glycoside hydrolase family 27 protein [Verrucomicrobiae bacterium]
MKARSISKLFFATWLVAAFPVLLRAGSQTVDPPYWQWAPTPPMGWNSWDSFGAGVWESNVIANADYMARHLKSHGWNIITIDIQWYEPLAHSTAYRRGAALEMDENGRLLPAPNRFPMTAATRSFKPIADYLHARGLKFGLHLMRGIPRQAVRENVPILGTRYRAADIANTNSTCAWNTDMYGVDMSKPGAQAYYDSVFALMASWGLDFVKVDDLSSPYHKDEIEAIRKAIDRSGRKIIFSTSPGATPLREGEHIETHANMWRISNDFWDSWPALYEQFARLNNWTPYRGPGHWPDADMLPLGNVRAWQTRDNWTHFTPDEQITLITLWCIARSPLIMGGNMPNNDDFTLSLMTNDEVLAVNQDSTNNRQLFNTNNEVAWVADVPGSRRHVLLTPRQRGAAMLTAERSVSKDKYVALFNTLPAPVPRGRRGGGFGANSASAATNAAETQARSISISLADLGFSGPVEVRDLWHHQDLGTFTGTFTQEINSHGAGLYRIHPQN